MKCSQLYKTHIPKHVSKNNICMISFPGPSPLLNEQLYFGAITLEGGKGSGNVLMFLNDWYLKYISFDTILSFLFLATPKLPI